MSYISGEIFLLKRYKGDIILLFKNIFLCFMIIFYPDLLLSTGTVVKDEWKVSCVRTDNHFSELEPNEGSQTELLLRDSDITQ